MAGTGRKGTEVGKGRAGSRIPKVVGNGGLKEVGANKNRAGTGVTGYGKWEVYPPPPRQTKAIQEFNQKIIVCTLLSLKEKG